MHRTHHRYSGELPAQSLLAETILDRISDGVVAFDRDWRYVYLNGAASSVLRGQGKEPSAVLGSDLWTEHPNLIGSEFERVMRDAMERGVTAEYEAYTGGWHLYRAFPDEYGLTLIISDVSERRLAQAALQESEARFRAVGRATNDVIWDWDLTTDRITWSESVQRTFRYTAEQVSDLSRWRATRIHAKDREIALAGLREVIAEGRSQWSAEYRFLRGDGTYATVFDRASVVRDDFGNAVRVVGSMLDLSDRVRLEAQLREAQRMEAVGQLAGGIAHDFNNLLTAILSATELALEEQPSESITAELVEVRHATHRAAALVAQLLAFGRRQVLRLETVGINDVIRGTEKILHRVLRENIQLTLLLDDRAGSVTADRSQLEQVLLNLVLNARDAMPAGGTVLVQTSVIDGATVEGAAAKPHVLLSVTDTGCGMDEATRARAFEPFFTTKEVGKGTGLGLSMVYGIVSQSEGRITIDSSKGVGTTINIVLPRHGDMVDTPEPARRDTRTATLSGRETILLVEDENFLRAIMRRALTQRGYSVLEATNGLEAIALAGAQATPIDLLITDVIMPELGGRALAEQLRQTRPALRVLFMSGYSAEAVQNHGMLSEDAELISKPFTPAQFLERVRALLDRPAPTDGGEEGAQRAG